MFLMYTVELQGPRFNFRAHFIYFPRMSFMGTECYIFVYFDVYIYIIYTQLYIEIPTRAHIYIYTYTYMYVYTYDDYVDDEMILI